MNYIKNIRELREVIYRNVNVKYADDITFMAYINAFLDALIYANQVKLIENIAASLPVGYYLYVKDHPHELAYRKAEDYRRLMQIPNVRLLRKSIPGKLVIRNAVGVFTINGTAGFEGLLLGIVTGKQIGRAHV